MILAMLAVTALILWFFFARVTLFANSSSILLTENGRLLVKFPKEALGQIRPGQAAILRLRTDPNQKPVAIPAVVFSLDEQNGEAEVLILDSQVPIEISPGALEGVVSVEVAYVTPVSLVLRATGNNVGQGNNVPVSPQTIKEQP